MIKKVFFICEKCGDVYHFGFDAGQSENEASVHMTCRCKKCQSQCIKIKQESIDKIVKTVNNIRYGEEVKKIIEESAAKEKAEKSDESTNDKGFEAFIDELFEAIAALKHISVTEAKHRYPDLVYRYKELFAKLDKAGRPIADMIVLVKED